VQWLPCNIVTLSFRSHTAGATPTNRSSPPNMSKHPSPDCTRSFSSSKTFILGTRKSALALVQAKLVADALRALYPSPSYEFPIKSMSTVGDRNQTTPLHLLTASSPDHPAKSLWTEELETSLMTGGMDMIVHALKDVPTTLKGGCEIACILKREDPRDAFVVRQGLEYSKLEDLPDGSVVGTGSVRRVAQLRRKFPNLKFEDMVSKTLPQYNGRRMGTSTNLVSSAVTCKHCVQCLSIPIICKHQHIAVIRTYSLFQSLPHLHLLSLDRTGRRADPVLTLQKYPPRQARLP
jgi:hypothetical protein